MERFRLPGPVSGQELMRDTSGWTPDAFAEYCVLLVSAAAGRPVQIGNRPNLPDGGVDAVIEMEDAIEARGLVGPGRNVYQWKRRDLFGRDHAKSVGELKKKARESLRSVMAHQGCDRFVFVTNVYLNESEAADFEAHLRAVPGAPAVVVVWGAAQLAQETQNRPQILLSCFPASSALVTHSQRRREHRRAMVGPDVELIGREKEIRLLADALADPEVRAVTVTGPSGAGKTRLVLEALKGRSAFVVWSPTPELLPADLIRRLDASRDPLTLVVDDAGRKQVEPLLRAALGRRMVKLILISRVAIPPQARVAEVALAPSRSVVAELVRRVVDRPVSGSEIARIVEDAGGLPGAALEIVAEARPGRLAFAMDAQTKQDLGILGLLPYVSADDIEAFSRVFGDPRRELEIAAEQAVLDGFAIRQGRFVSIVPGILARHLAEDVINEDILLKLLAHLPVTSLPRLFERLGRSDRARDLWRELLADESVTDLPHYALDELAEALPAETLAYARRADVEGEGAARWLMKVALQPEHFADAVDALAAAVGSEPGDPALRSLDRLFHWVNQWAGPGLSCKADVLRRLSRRYPDIAARIAAGVASERVCGDLLSVRRREPLPVGEFRDFGDAALDALMPAGAEPRGSMAREAMEIAFAFGSFERSRGVLQRLKPRFPTDTRDAVQWAHAQKTLPDRERRAFDSMLDDLRPNTASPSSLDERTRFELGPRTKTEVWTDAESVGGFAEAEAASEEKVVALAREVAQDPCAVRPGTWDAILDGSLFDNGAIPDRCMAFFRALGRAEGSVPRTGERLMSALEDMSEASRFLGPYVAGLEQAAPAEASRFRDSLLRADTDAAARAYLGAVWAQLPADGWTGVVELIRRGRVGRDEAAGLWGLRGLDSEAIVEALEALDDGSPDAARAIVERGLFLGADRFADPTLRVYAQGIVQRAFEAKSRGLRWGVVAGWIGEHDLDSAFRLLRKVSSRLAEIEMETEGRSLWDICMRHDSPRALEELLAGLLERYRATGLYPLGAPSLQGMDDIETIVGFARKHPGDGPVVAAGLLRARGERFFEVAGELIDLAPENLDVRSALFSASRSASASGSFVPVFEDRLSRAKIALERGPMTEAARVWLREVIADYECRTEQEQLHDAEIDLAGLRHRASSDDPSVRRWAITRIFRRHPNKMREWLTRQQFEEELPNLRLDKTDRNIAEKMIESWQRTG